MRWPWRQRRAIEPRRAVSSKAMELQTAKEILAEVFWTAWKNSLASMCWLQTAKEILAEVFHARRGGGDDTKKAGGERAGGAQGGAVAGDVLPGGVEYPTFLALTKA
jgi:hypothetical protein